MLHLLASKSTAGRHTSTSEAGGAALSYDQLDGADPASCGLGSSRSILELAGRLVSTPLGGLKSHHLKLIVCEELTSWPPNLISSWDHP